MLIFIDFYRSYVIRISLLVLTTNLRLCSFHKFKFYDTKLNSSLKTGDNICYQIDPIIFSEVICFLSGLNEPYLHQDKKQYNAVEHAE